MPPAAPPHVVVTGVLLRGDRALLVHRAAHRRWYPDCWDVPGGHLEPGEIPAEALVRELAEELGIRAEVRGEPFAHVHGHDFRMEVFVVERWQGEPALLDAEHDDLAWLTPAELDGLRLADSRLPALLTAALSARSASGAARPRRRGPARS